MTELTTSGSTDDALGAPIRWREPPSRAQITRDRLWVLSVIAVVVWLGFAVQYALAGYWLTVAVDLTVVALTSLVLVLCLRKAAPRLVVGGHLAVAVSAGGLVCASLLSGGSSSLAIWFLVVAPLFAAHALGTRAAIVWTVVVIASIVTILVVESTVTLVPEFLPSQGELAIGRVFLVLTIFAFAVASRRLLDEQVQRLSDQAQALRREVEHRETSEAWQRQFRALVDEGADMIWIADADSGQIIDANRTARRTLGFKSRELRAMKLFELAPDLGDPQDWADMVKRLVEEGSLLRDLTARVKHDQGVPCEVAFKLLERGSSGFVIALARDVRERRRIETIRGEMFSIVSHEFRTPLTAMKGALALLEAGLEQGEIATPRTVELVEMAHRNADRLSRLTNDLLELKSIEAGALELDPSAFPVRELFQTIERDQAALAHELGIRLDVAATSDLLVFADQDRSVEVLINLVSNAFKFSVPGGSVCLSATATEEHVRIAVTDQGPGIGRADWSRVFEPFEQVDSSDTRNKNGTGLGLAICKALIEGQGGTIGLESEPGAGATFYVELPRARTKDQKSQTGQSDPPVVLGPERDVASA